jgi:acetolactate synthase I/II/III large subunit
LSKIKGYVAAAQALRQHDVGPIFGLMGDANMHYVASFIEREGGHFVTAVDERGAAAMADGYARVSGRVGVVSITSGPAATNAMTATVEAVRVQTPLLLITGDTPPQRYYLQHINLEQLYSATGTDYWRVLAPEHIVDDIGMVLAKVAVTRRPLVLDLPHEVLHAEVDYTPSSYRVRPRQAVAPDEDALDEALGVIMSCRRPVILAGRGAVLSGARDALVELAGQLGAPLATTVNAKEFFRGVPYDIGVMGTISNARAVDVLSQSDCLIVFGAGMGVRTTDHGALSRGRAIVRCDDAPFQLGRGLAADAPVVGDARRVAERMVERLTAAGVHRGHFREDVLDPPGTTGSDPRAEFADSTAVGTLDMRTAMIRLDELLPADRVVVTDAGRFAPAAWKYLRVRDARDFLQTSGNWGSIGLGMAATIGASCAKPDRLTVGVLGDGGGMMGLIEFSSAVRNNLPVLIDILNDGSYGSEYKKFLNAGIDPKFSLMEWPEFADVAVALGGDGVTVRGLADLEDAVAHLGKLARPMLIDIKCDPTIVME